MPTSQCQMNVKGQMSNPSWHRKGPFLTFNHFDFIDHLGLVIWHLRKALYNISGIANTPDPALSKIPTCGEGRGFSDKVTPHQGEGKPGCTVYHGASAIKFTSLLNISARAISRRYSYAAAQKTKGLLFITKEFRMPYQFRALKKFLVPAQAGRSTFPATSALSGLAVPKFDVKLPFRRAQVEPFRRAQVEPFYSIDAYLCGLLKESPMVLPVLFSKG